MAIHYMRRRNQNSAKMDMHTGESFDVTTDGIQSSAHAAVNSVKPFAVLKRIVTNASRLVSVPKKLEE